MSKYVGKLKTGPNKSHSYLIHPECMLCNARDRQDKPIREIIDKFLISNSTEKTSKMLLTNYSLNISPNTIKAHMERHSPYLKEVKSTILKAVERAAMNKVESVAEEYIEAEDVIQEIITIGGRKVRAGEIEVDGKLLLGAIKEQGTRKQQGRLRDLIEELDKGRFREGEILDGVAVERLDAPK